jgi:hypothetical protein
MLSLEGRDDPTNQEMQRYESLIVMTTEVLFQPKCVNKDPFLRHLGDQEEEGLRVTLSFLAVS